MKGKYLSVAALDSEKATGKHLSGVADREGSERNLGTAGAGQVQGFMGRV